MTPIVNGLEQEYEGQTAFVRLNVIEPDALALQAGYGQRGHPSFVVLDAEGQATASFIGPQPVEKLREAIDQSLRGSPE